MSLSDLLQERLAKQLHERLQDGGPGFCIRVDYLGREDAGQVCAKLRMMCMEDDEAFVLSADPHSDHELSPEKAIEIRNRKQLRLCLFVPVGVMDAAASSLTNSFGCFDLAEFWKEASNDLLAGLPSAIQPAVRRVLTTLRGAIAATSEQRVDYLGAVSADPVPRTVGREMWRLGLIPDVGESDFVERLEKNQTCVRELSRPIRAHSSPEERLESLRLADVQFGKELQAFFTGKRLRDSRTWLQALSQPSYLGTLTFDQWVFEEGEQSDLLEIEVEPLLNGEGVVEAYTKLRQSEIGAQPVAPVGAKASVSVKWSSSPLGPANLSRWKAELIPSREYYSENEIPTVDLPSARAAGKSRRVTIPLDIELSDEEPAVAVQVRIVGLDASGAELSSAEGIVVEGLSEEFWLTSDEVGEDTGSTKDKQATANTLALGRLRAAGELAVDALDEAPGQWNERDLHYFSVRFNGRYVVKLGLSPILRRLEERIIERHDELGCYRARIESGGTLDINTSLESVQLNVLLQCEEGKKFVERRRDFLSTLRRQEHRGLVETADWNDELCKRARSYANAYLTLLSQNTDAELMREALRVDTLSLSISSAGSAEQSVLLAPTHPLRVLWYSAYAELLRSWEGTLLSTEKRQRKTLLDFDLLQQVAPLHCPSFVPSEDGSILLFAQNLLFFWGIALPVDVQDPAKRIASVARALAIADDDSALSDLAPERVTNEFHAYNDVHPYLESIRLNCINPGNAGFLADVLRRYYTGGTRYSTNDEESDSVHNLPRLELFAHVHRPVPTALPPLVDLQSDLYDIQPRGRRQYFSPFFSVSLRAIEDAKTIPGGDVNLSMIFDMLTPTITATGGNTDGDSATFYALLMRMKPEFYAQEGQVRWRHRFHIAESAQVAKHPVVSAYSTILIDLHRAYLVAISRLLGGNGDCLPAIEVTLDEEQRAYVDVVHQQSDWVITLDRFFDVEFFDAPQEKQLSDISNKFLLDYAPEFLEGLGHRMLVTTMHREEVEQILARAMDDLGFSHVEDSVGKVFDHLKTISGRLALRILGDDSRAREAVSLGVVAAYLRSSGDLQNSILVPVDAHPELFGPQRKKKKGEAALRCDLIQVRFLRNRLVAQFIEVKSRSAAGQSDELLNRIVDQIDATVAVFQDLFFSSEPQRIDHNLQRSRLATILQFYLRRAERYGLITSEDERKKLEEGISRLETGVSELRVDRRGYVVNLKASPQRPAKLRDAEIHFLTADSVSGAGLSVVETPQPIGTTPVQPRESEDDARGDKRIQSGHSGGDDMDRVEPECSTLASTEDAFEKASQPTTEVMDNCEVTAPEVCEVELGTDLASLDPIVWRTGVRGSPHLFIIGIPGQGKSWTTTRLLCELHRQSLPSVVLDFHGQFGSFDGQYAKVASPTVLDVTHGLPFSPFEADRGAAAGTSSWQANCFAIAEIFEYVCDLGDMQRDVVYQALRDCYLDVGFDTEAPERLPTVQEFQRRLEEIEEERGVKNVVARCRPLLEFGLFRADAQPTEFGEAIKHGLVINVSGLGMETLQLAAGAFVLRKIYKDMFLWGEASHLRLAIVLDEAHRLARDVTLPKIMKEGRKFGVAVIVASQGLGDFHPDVVGNAGTKVIFRTNFPMSKKVAGFVRGKKSFDLAEQIEQLEVGEAFVQTPEMNYCSRVRMHPLKES